MWTQFQNASHYAQGNGQPNANAVLFMYHPHGRPDAAVVRTSSGSTMTPSGGNSSSLEDIYWIYYAPRTSATGNTNGRTVDGFVMSAWVGSNDLTFNGSINQAGAAQDGDEAAIADLTYLSGD